MLVFSIVNKIVLSVFIAASAESHPEGSDFPNQHRPAPRVYFSSHTETTMSASS